MKDYKNKKHDDMLDCKKCNQLITSIDWQACSQCIRILEPYIDQSKIKCADDVLIKLTGITGTDNDSLTITVGNITSLS